MIICMSDIICVTNRKLCNENFLARIEKLAAAHPAGIILREKDLSEKEYIKLAGEVIEICKGYNTPCILHTFAGAAKRLDCRSLHLPLNILAALGSEDKTGFDVLGASCHSAEDAVKAEWLGCTYITAGHIFDTDCKKDLPGRGLDFLQRICESVSIPVYAIGGISSGNIDEVRKHGAAGACVMSAAMRCDDIGKYLGELK